MSNKSFVNGFNGHLMDFMENTDSSVVYKKLFKCFNITETLRKPIHCIIRKLFRLCMAYVPKMCIFAMKNQMILKL